MTDPTTQSEPIRAATDIASAWTYIKGVMAVMATKHLSLIALVAGIGIFIGSMFILTWVAVAIDAVFAVLVLWAVLLHERGK